MNNKNHHNGSRGQFVSLGAVVLSLLIITGVSVAYIGVSNQEERDNAITPTQDVEESTLTISRSTYDVFATTNQDPTITSYTTREAEVEDSIREYVKSYDKPNSGVYGVVNYNIRTSKTYDGYMVSQTDPSANLSTEVGGSVKYSWEAFSGARDARQAVMVLNRSTIPPKSYPVTLKPRVSINTDSRNFSVSRNTTDNTIYLNDTDVSGDNGICSVSSVSDDRVKIDFLRGEINGVTCSDIKVESAVNNLKVHAGSSVGYDPSGTFSTIYNANSDTTTSGVTASTTLAGYGEADTPEQTKVVYAVVMDIRVVELGSSITRPVIISPGKHQTSLE